MNGNLAEQDFIRLMTFIRDNYGVNLEKKKTLVEGRLRNVIAQAGYADFHDYIEAALGEPSGELLNTIITRLTTNYTYFMREETHYQFMQQQMLPEWTARIRDRDLRTWSAGCATGEEAYTAAMVIQEYLGGEAGRWDATILGTDISTRVLDEAREGVYTAAALERLPPPWRSKYFVDEGGDRFRVSKRLGEQVAFARQNLMEASYSARFKRKFHLIFCRNVMIYYNAETKAAVAGRFFDVLEPGGYLFIGLSETLSGLNSRFEQVAPSIYRRGL
ncbi:MAG: chemotaxis protein CheR [Clostridiales bacterium]|nr:chemotaxis protein CheR [Clostridiales bacterium]